MGGEEERGKGRNMGEGGGRRRERRMEKGKESGERGREGEDQLAAKARSMRERSSGVYMVW